MARMSGKTIIVTGAGHGIGRAYAQRLATEGANVVAADIDGDGALDLIASTDAGIEVWWGDGAGQFSDPHSLGRGSSLVDDLDGDGKPDVVVAGGEKVSVFMNRLSGRPTH